MPVSYTPPPYPNPTPYQSPAQGGNAYVTPGTIGPAIPQNAVPNINQSYANQSTPVSWSTGQVTPASSVNVPNYVQATSQNSTPAGQVAGASSSSDQNNSSNSGGGPADTRLQQLEKMNRNPVQEQEYQSLLSQLNVPAGPSDQQLNSAYDPIFAYLNQAQSTLSDLYNRQNSLYDTQGANRQAELATEKQNSLKTINDLKDQSGQRKEDVMTSARRLYNELGMANKQRFGGSTSAGQAASELQSIEMQRAQASAQKGYEQTMREIGTKEIEVNSQYQVNLNRIKEQVDAAKQQAYSDFQNGLLEIARNRAQTESEKAQRKLNYLDQYKQQLFQVQLADRQMQQELDTWKQQQDYQLAIYKQQLSASSQGASSLVSNYNNQTTTSPTSQYTVGSQVRSQVPSYTGYKSSEDLQGYAPGIYDQNKNLIGSAYQPMYAN